MNVDFECNMLKVHIIPSVLLYDKKKNNLADEWLLCKINQQFIETIINFQIANV